MVQFRQVRTWILWVAAGLFLVVLTAGAMIVFLNLPGHRTARAQPKVTNPQSDEDPTSQESSPTVVEVVLPQKGMDLEVEQPGSVHSWETVDLHARVSGFLKSQTVDIGDPVAGGAPLAEIDVPELQKQLQGNQASLEQAHANVAQMEARVTSAKADEEAAAAAVKQAEAAHKSAAAWVRFRKLQYERMKALFQTRSIEEKLVDESKERYEASLETERSAAASIATSNANLAAAGAKIKQADADVAGAKASVKVAQAQVEKTQVYVNFAKITAPFDGKITYRGYFPGDFIRSAGDGSGQGPLFTVKRTDKFRVIVQVPDSAIRYLDKGDPAVVRIDSLPGRRFIGTVSRKSDSEDPNTRLMRVEIDLPNPTGEIRDGTYGKVTIILERFPNLLSIPVSAKISAKGNTWTVFVVNGTRVERRNIEVKADNGMRVAVAAGLRPEDQVVLHPSGGIEGAEVQTRLVEQPRAVPTDEP
jgi:RND family efflux transporter MFP subunit